MRPAPSAPRMPELFRAIMSTPTQPPTPPTADTTHNRLGCATEGDARASVPLLMMLRLLLLLLLLFVRVPIGRPNAVPAVTTHRAANIAIVTSLACPLSRARLFVYVAAERTHRALGGYAALSTSEVATDR